MDNYVKLMTYTSAKAKNEAIEILRGYSGYNPYLLMLEKDVIIWLNPDD